MLCKNLRVIKKFLFMLIGDVLRLIIVDLLVVVWVKIWDFWSGFFGRLFMVLYRLILINMELGFDCVKLKFICLIR